MRSRSSAKSLAGNGREKMTVKMNNTAPYPWISGRVARLFPKYGLWLVEIGEYVQSRAQCIFGFDSTFPTSDLRKH
jgi:hypothetical protein